MKKIYLFLVCSLLILSQLQAQFKFGVGGGVHNSFVQEKNNLPGWNQDFKGYYSQYTGFHAGAYAEYAIDKKANWTVQASVLYNMRGRNFSKSYDSAKSFITDTSSIISKWRMNYAELPVNLVYRIPVSSNVRLIVGAGGYAGLYLNSKTSYTLYNGSGEQTHLDNTLATGDQVNKYNKFDYGVNGLAGFDFNDKIMITANYARSLSDFYTASYGGSFKHQSWGASMVVWLTKSKTSKAKEAARDSDGDGVPDKDDLCKDEKGTPATNGCPDTDGDGIPDNIDKCPGIPGLSHLSGCPLPDADNDGIPDEEDKCPDVAGVKELDGCPLPPPPPDTDGDGVPDVEDKCPTKAGTRENKGCPAIDQTFEEDFRKAARGIRFDVNSDNINRSSFEALDRVAQLMIENPEMSLDIEGHTDNTGSVRINQVLSGRRALAIKSYLVSKGVSADRMTATGFGSEKPIADNSTEKGRALNRRVELKAKY
ncbi:MAG: OmpA family protein [Chitinophagaceae bacterium]|nr:OmpA family protein [Chitinophagaceae bacterium]MCW5927524.1 OmpA family protein [Chitinophagaceae bacterium]